MAEIISFVCWDVRRATPGTNAQFGAPKDVKIICLNGQGHADAEDVGETWGWENLKAAYWQPRKKENKELISWYKDGCLNGDKKGLDPHAWDILDVNDELRDLGLERGSEGRERSVDSHCECCGEHEDEATTD